jgi:hypothetical protein
MHSGEISLASFGGFIYLKCKINERGEIISHRVVGVNALSMGPALAYDGGAVDLTDKKVTATIAAPEMCDGVNIGLEADMYSFGIVMWEVFTRRTAWHWLGGVKEAVLDKVGNECLRPKVPADLSPECARMLRRCLHTDPDCRPTAREMGIWLRGQKAGLGKFMHSQETTRLRESDEIKRKEEPPTILSPRSRTAQSSPRQATKWFIIDHSREGARHWNHGRYSLESSAEVNGLFHLTISDTYHSDWEERALGHGYRGGLPAQKLIKARQFGLKCGDQWPTIVTIDHQTTHPVSGEETLASMFPQIKVGCRITHINGRETGSFVAQFPTFDSAKATLKARPLELVFSSPAQAKIAGGWLPLPWPTPQPSLGSPDVSAIPAWLGGIQPSTGARVSGGLDAVALVRSHEQKLSVRARGRARGMEAVTLVKRHEEQCLREQLAAAQAEIEDLKRQLAARPPQQPPEADPGASQRANA